jgi:JAB1/Mov34/MPN/PAD-1 ubiquitin protease
VGTSAGICLSRRELLKLSLNTLYTAPKNPFAHLWKLEVGLAKFFCICPAARERVLGWYHTGPRLREADLDIHNLMTRYCETPILVICEVEVKGKACTSVQCSSMPYYKVTLTCMCPCSRRSRGSQPPAIMQRMKSVRYGRDKEFFVYDGIDLRGQRSCCLLVLYWFVFDRMAPRRARRCLSTFQPKLEQQRQKR